VKKALFSVVDGIEYVKLLAGEIDGLIWRAGMADKCYAAGAPQVTISDEYTIEDKQFFTSQACSEWHRHKLITCS
jgi:hypothetical protein